MNTNALRFSALLTAVFALLLLADLAPAQHRHRSTALRPGVWVDGNGDRLELSATRGGIRVDVLSERLKRFWTEASGPMRGGRVTLRHHLRGRVVDTTQGQLSRRGDRIHFTNGTTWRRVLTPELVNGTWQDSNGDSFRLRVHGGRVVVTVDSGRLRRYWQRAEGQLAGNQVRLRHLDRGQVADTTFGTIARDGKSITLTNGTRWSYVPVIVIKPVLMPRAGLWRDANGDQIRLTLNDGRIHVTAISPRLRRHWQTATGTLNLETGRFQLRHLNGCRLVATTQASVFESGARVIHLAGGSIWTFLR